MTFDDQMAGAMERVLKAPRTTSAATKPQPTKQEIDALMRTSGAPARHVVRSAEHSGPWGATFAVLRKRLGNGFLVVLHGTNGNGKTQMAVELMRCQIGERQKTAMFTTSMDFFIAVKRSYRDNATEGEGDVVRLFSMPGLLVIDEMEKRGESDWEDRLLFHLINVRYNAMKDTVLISNLDRNEVAAHLGRSLVSRLNETGGLVHCDWPSRR